MRKYVKNMIGEFPINIENSQSVTIPATKNLFKVGISKPLNNNKAELFHKIVARGLFFCKRARPDIQTTISILCTREKQFNQRDWNKLPRLKTYLLEKQ